MNNEQWAQVKQLYIVKNNCNPATLQPCNFEPETLNPKLP